MMRTRLLFVCLAFATAPLLACSQGEATVVNESRKVVLSPVGVRTLDVRIGATGELMAKNRARVAAEVPGQVTAILIDEGRAVETGQTVLEIDPERRQLEADDARAQHSEARANLAEQVREVERIRKLHSQDIASQSRLDQAETKLTLARSRAAAARARMGVALRSLRDASVRAPFAGRIAERIVSAGEFVNPGTPLFELVALDPIEVEFHLAEVDSGRVETGDPVEVTVAPHPDETFQAIVTVISPTIDRTTRTLRVKAELANPDGRLRPGLFARASLGVAERHGVVMVPEEAILQRAAGPVVFRFREGNRVERVVIDVGIHQDGTVEVRSGLSDGDLVVTRGHAWLSDGEVVDPRNLDGTIRRLPVAQAEPTTASLP